MADGGAILDLIPVSDSKAAAVMTLRIVFMGTPDFSVPTLSEILGAGHDVVAVYSQPPRPAGRGMDARKSPVQRKQQPRKGGGD